MPPGQGGKDVPDPHLSSPARGLEKRCKLPSGVRGGNLAIYKPLLVSIMLILNFKKNF